MPPPRSVASPRSLVAVVLIPFALAATGAAVFETSIRAAHACSCSTGDFWVLEKESVDGAQASWPSGGFLWGRWMSLEEPGSIVTVWYSP